ncbi:3-oxo-5-alpha-steroid 4-dehydrogenase [gut metagenome]|uniref:3-oxo-5-alpha-steroid 4-dehydrogenase n=1 Tax=gut metagenome TaxID=749906 RepID=J9D866_9ZZZZ
MKGKSKMPVSIMAMGVVFNVLNGMMQAGGLFYFPSSPSLYEMGWAYFSQLSAWLGVFLFF